MIMSTIGTSCITRAWELMTRKLHLHLHLLNLELVPGVIVSFAGVILKFGHTLSTTLTILILSELILKGYTCTLTLSSFC